MSITKLTLGSLFAGIGGFDYGFSMADFSGKWAVEWDEKCQSILRRHFPECDIHGDITSVQSNKLSPVDVITFGSPCQDLSHAGKRVGITGSRSRMFFEAIRIIKDLDPKIAIWENVTGSLSSNNGNDFLCVIKHMSMNGSRNVAYRVLDSQYFGVPQRRRRVFVVSAQKEFDCKKILSIDSDYESDYFYDHKFDHDSPIFSIQDVRAIDKKQNGKGWSRANVAYTIDTKATQGVAVGNIISYGFKPGQSSSARTDGSSIEVCPTLETSGGGNNKPAVATIRDSGCIVRRIAPSEAERLQGFPDDWTKFGIDKKGNIVMQNNTARFNQLGNAVTVNVAKWIANNVKEEILKKSI